MLKIFRGPGYLHSEEDVFWLFHLLVNLYICLTISSCYDSISLTSDLSLGLIRKDGGLTAPCHSSRFSWWEKVLKTFPGPGYLCSEDEVVWLCHLLVNLYIWLTISSCYDSIPLNLDLSLGLPVTDGGLSTLYHSCGFACHQKKLKTFLGSGYLRSQDEVVWLCHLLVNLYILLTISSCCSSISLTLDLNLGWIRRDGGLSTLCHSWGFPSQQRVPKTFPGLGYLRPEDEVI